MSATGQAAGSNGGDGGTQGGEAAQTQSFDASALQQQLQDTQGGVDALRQQFGQFLESAPWQPQETQQEQETGIDLSFLDGEGYIDPAYGQEQRDQMQQQFSQSVQAEIDRRVQQALTPLQQQQQEFQREQRIRDLIGEHPEFQDPKVAQHIAGPDGLARQWADSIGQPQLAQDPGFWRLVYMADRAAQQANGEEGQQAPNAATLEGSGGSGPASAQTQNVADQIFGESRKGSAGLPFG